MTISRWVVLGSLLAASIAWQPASGASVGMPAGSTVWMEFQATGGAVGSNQAGLAPPNGIPLTTIPSTLDPNGRGTGYAEILPTSIRTLVDGFRSGAVMHASFQDTYTVGGAAAGPFDITVQLHVTGSMSGLTLFGQTALIGVVDAEIGTFNPGSDPDFNEGSRVSPFDAGAQASTGLRQVFGPPAAGSFPVDITASYTKTGVNVNDVFDIAYYVRSFASSGQIDLRNTGTISFVLPEGVFLTSALAESLLPVPGDHNVDGTVDAADYVVWRKTDSGNSQGYTDWQANFGEGMGAGGGSADFGELSRVGASPSQAGVPEPETLVLLMFAATGWCLRRWRTI